jgi:antitoxin component of MazEF toxin-antitoxin module
MIKTLTRTGNSLALVIDKSLLEATGIAADTPLEVSTDGDVIVIEGRQLTISLRRDSQEPR